MIEMENSEQENSKSKKDISVTIKIKPKDYLQLHRDSQARLNNHRQALWEIQKHFTWWIYITISILIALLISEFLESHQKVILITIGSIIGLLLTIAGFLAACRESKEFEIALAILKKIEENMIDVTVNEESKRCKLSIRKIFNWIYLFAIFGFITIIILVWCLL